VSYTLIAFTVFSDSCGHGHYKAYCKKGDTGDWYLFDDENITKKRGDIALISTKGNIGTQVTLLYYLKNVEATMKKSVEKAQGKLVQEVDHGCDDVGTEERDLAQIQKRGGEETTAEEEEDMMSTNALTKAPIDPTTASGTINGAYVSYSAQRNNIHRSHQIAFPELLGGLMTQEKPSGTSNGVYISSPIQHNNIIRSRGNNGDVRTGCSGVAAPYWGPRGTRCN